MENINTHKEVGNHMNNKEALEANACNLCILTRKEQFQYLVKDVSQVNQELRTSTTEESVNNTLNKLSNLMDRLSNDSQVADVKSLVMDISGTIRGVKLHDITRSALVDMLDKLLERAMEIIAEENKKENVNKLKLLLMELAKNSDKIAEIIDITNFLG